MAPITTDKHFVGKTNASLASGVGLGINVVNAIARGTIRTATEEVDEGSVVKAVHLEYWLNGRGSTATTQFQMIVLKLVGEAGNVSFTDMANLSAYQGKKNILYTTQGVLAEAGSQSVPVIRDWVKIPKGKQRMGLGDRIQVVFTAIGEPIQICGMAIFKEYL